MKRHGEWLYGVHRTRRDGSRFTWHQPCQRCKYTTSVDIQKRAIKQASHSCRITCERSESAWERRIELYKSNHHRHDVFIINFNISVMSLTPSLPQCKMSGPKDAQAPYRQCIFWSCNISTFSAMRFDEIPFTCQCKEQDLGVSNLANLSVVFKWHLGSEEVNTNYIVWRVHRQVTLEVSIVRLHYLTLVWWV